MATVWEKISKANDAACAIFKALGDYDVNQTVDRTLKDLFKVLEEVRSQISSNLFVEKDDYAPQLMKELGPSNRNERSLNAVRYMARVNLATFTIAIWTATDLPRMLTNFFPHVIPKHYEYSKELFDAFVEISTWAAGIDVEKQIETDDISYILRQYLQISADELGVPEMKEELEPLISMLQDKHDWIMQFEYLEDWQVQTGDVRSTWNSICYDIMSQFDHLYPSSSTQVSTRSEADEDDIIVKFEEQSEEPPQVQPTQETTQEVLLREDFMEESDVQLEEEDFTENSEGDPNEKEAEVGEVEEDELDEDDEGDTFMTPTESLASESTSGRRSTSAQLSPPPGEDLKRDLRNHNESEEDDIPRIKRPRVIPANLASQMTQLSQDYDMVSNLESQDDRSIPNKNAASNNKSSTANLEQIQQTQPPELHPFYADQSLPHGLPGTINEGPASPIPDDDDRDEQNDTTYREILQSTTPERSISMGAVPKRIRRDLPFSTNTQLPDTIDRGARALSPIDGAQAPSRHQRTGRKPYTPWNNEELEALEAGLAVHGASWSDIKREFSGILAQRTNVQIKDKARTEYKARANGGLELGVYACMVPKKLTAEQINLRSERTARNRRQKQREQSEDQ